MANVIQLRRSAVQGAVPTTAQLNLGELAINTYDGRVFLKKNDGAESIVELSKVISSANNGATTTGNITPVGTVDTYDIFGLTGNITILTPSGVPTDGKKLMLRIRDNGTSRGITWTTSTGAYRAIGTTLPTSTSPSKLIYIGCIYNATDSFWDIIGVTSQT